MSSRLQATRITQHASRLHASRIIWIAILLLAFYLRIASLFDNSFHADEALFGSWARHIAAWRDPLLLTQTVDKPPLLVYLQALIFPLAGGVEWAARLPNFAASILTVPLTAVLLQNLYKVKIKDPANTSPLHLIPSSPHLPLFTTALIVASSPLAIQFSSTAFTDPLLTFWIVAALVASCRWQVAGGKTGVLFGLAVATKYQAWLFLPLLVGIGWLRGWRWREWQRFVFGLLPVLAVVLLWEWARTGTFSLWSAQISNYGGVRMAWSWELLPRLLAWGDLWTTAVPVTLLPIFLPLTLFLFVRAWRVGDEYGRIDLLLILFLLGYILLHWLLAVPVWDRYLLPLVPLVAVLFGRGVMGIGRWGDEGMRSRGDEEQGSGGVEEKITSSRLHVARITHHASRITFFIILLLLIFPAISARNGRFPVGGQREADDGAAQIAELLVDEPYGTVLYDHWYSWQWAYHLFDDRVYVSWFPHADALVEDLTVFGRDGSPRYIALPDTAVSQPIHRAINDAGFTLQPVGNAGKIALFEIIPKE